ncbi:MAG TPA: DUF4336 domain-containing protein [Polyangiaceae bacterium]|jgi:hypothetical protein|nr:DUF4336 domain-containing protein [Polyangiaceae bacterium]
MGLRELVRDQIWLADYPVSLFGTRFDARMTLVRRSDGALMVHSPGPMDDAMRARIEAIGSVAVIVAPGNFHHLHVASCQRAFPEAETWICPGVERKQPALRYDGFLGDSPPPCLASDFTLAGVFGRLMCEVAMLHRPSRTLLLVDLIENFGDRTPRINWMLKAWWKLFRMWNVPAPAPEYRVGWRDRAEARAALEKIVAWDFERIVLAHGELIEHDARAAAQRAWRRHLPHVHESTSTYPGRPP